MPSSPAQKRPRRGLIRFVLLGAGIFAALLTLLVALLARNRVTPDLMEPPASILSPAVETKSGKTYRATSRRPVWDKPAPPKDFMEYLEFRRQNPDDARAVERYLSLAEHFKTADLMKEFGDCFQKTDANGRYLPWRADVPLTEDQKQWLIDHRDLIDQIHQLMRNGGPPVPSSEEFAAFPHAPLLSHPIPNFLLFQTSAKILRAEAQRLVEAGEPDTARLYVEDIFDLSSHIQASFLIGNLISIAIQSNGNSQIAGWLEAGHPMPPEAARALSQTLADHRYSMPDQRLSFELEYRATREFGVRALSGSVLELINSIYKSEFHRGLPSPGENDFAFILEGVENPGAALESTWSALRMRANAAQSIRAYDDYWSKILDGLNNPYAQSPAAAGGLPPFVNDEENLFSVAFPNLPEVLIRATVNEAGLNLNRAGIDLLLDNKIPDLAPNAPLPQDHPWRDPFTENPLRAINESDRATIYSVGPDMLDQQGRVAYDPTNGSRSAGDLILRVPRR